MLKCDQIRYDGETDSDYVERLQNNNVMIPVGRYKLDRTIVFRNTETMRFDRDVTIIGPNNYSLVTMDDEQSS